jgi:hypothetical protein
MQKKHVLALIVAWLAIAPAVADDAPSVMFGGKYFTDLGNVVAVEGSPAKDGANPDDTTRWVFWCYQERRECLGFTINTASNFVSILPGVPLIYSVKVWAPDRIVAALDLGCGDRETWLLDRLRKTAEVFGGSCNDNTRAGHRTIEDPPSWKKLRQRLGDDRKPRP